MNFSGDQIELLHNLLSEQHENPHESKNQHQPSMSTSKTVIKDRNTIIESSSSTSSSSSSSINNKSKIKNDKDIWDIDEVPTLDELLASSGDQRIPPKYTFYYKNSLGTEDMFLGMSDITPASRDATHLVSYL
jgi:hypothetical protein